MKNDPLRQYKPKEKLKLKDMDLDKQEVYKIVCPACSSHVPSGNLNIQTNVAKCNSCDGVFSFSSQVDKLTRQGKLSQEILHPEGVTLDYFDGELDISVEQPWYDSEIVGLTSLPVLIMFIGVLISTSLPPGPIARVGVISFLLFSAIAYVAYFFIRKKHKLYIHIDDMDVYVEHRPKKFIRDRKYAIEDVDQVYTKKSTGSNTSFKFTGAAVMMIVNTPEGQKHVELIKNVNSRSKAKYIEQEIERYLQITDREVPDELD